MPIAIALAAVAVALMAGVGLRIVVRSDRRDAVQWARWAPLIYVVCGVLVLGAGTVQPAHRGPGVGCSDGRRCGLDRRGCLRCGAQPTSPTSGRQAPVVTLTWNGSPIAG